MSTEAAAVALAEDRIANRIYSATVFEKDEIALATKELALAIAVARAACQTLEDNFNAHKPVEIKLCCEQLKRLGGDLEKKARQLSGLASHMADTFGQHARRRAYIGG